MAVWSNFKQGDNEKPIIEYLLSPLLKYANGPLFTAALWIGRSSPALQSQLEATRRVWTVEWIVQLGASHIVH